MLPLTLSSYNSHGPFNRYPNQVPTLEVSSTHFDRPAPKKPIHDEKQVSQPCHTSTAIQDSKSNNGIDIDDFTVSSSKECQRNQTYITLTHSQLKGLFPAVTRHKRDQIGCTPQTTVGLYSLEASCIRTFGPISQLELKQKHTLDR